MDDVAWLSAQLINLFVKKCQKVFLDLFECVDVFEASQPNFIKYSTRIVPVVTVANW